MSKSAQLKRKAAEFEQKRQYDRALATYTQAIEASAGIPDELDIPLYNRVGDLHLRLGDLDRAIAYYETAVDLYAEGGFFNNAMALCNKVLRHAPGRTVIYYKLGKISAQKGFHSDAKQNFLEYASRIEKSGDVSEAFRALKEFADLCPGQDEVRLMLAEQLARAGRTQEALEQLQTVYEAMTAEGRDAEATATLARIRALDPSFQPSAERAFRKEKREGLVFLDVDDFRELEAQPGPPAAAPPASAPAPAAPVVPPVEDIAPVAPAAPHVPVAPPPSGPPPLSAAQFGEIALPPAADTPAPKTFDGSPLAGLTPLEDPMIALAAEAAAHEATPLGLEPTDLGSGGGQSFGAPLDLEHTAFDVISPVSLPSDVHAGTPEPAENLAWPDELTPGEPTSAAPDAAGAALHPADAVTDYVESLSSDISSAAGGLPGDIGILPPEALDEVQHAAPAEDEFVDLNQWLLETEPARNPRMTAEGEPEGTGRSETDFTQMLDTFKAGVAANVDAGDADSHYDLGVAYMEMGLLDEAISQFQTAIRAGGSPESRVRAYESLGQSFIEQRQYELAIESLRGALAEPGLADDKLVGVLYLLGYSAEQLERWQDAEGYYRRVLAMDIHFRDIGDRVKHAEQMR